MLTNRLWLSACGIVSIPGAWGFQLQLQTSQMLRLDPVVSPGKVASHLHQVAAPNTFAATVTEELLTSANCTRVQLQMDKSAYWMAPIVGQNPNGSWTAFPGFSTSVYYRNPFNLTLDMFPENFRMLVGSPDVLARNTQDPYISFQCQNFLPDGTPNDTSQYVSLPHDQTCQAIEISISAPECGTGEPDASDHRSHIAYSNPDGTCPEGFPFQYPAMTIEMVFWTEGFPRESYFLANGDWSGFTAHVDYIFGWEDRGAVLLDALNNDPTCGLAQTIIPTDEGYCETIGAYFDKVQFQECMETPFNIDIPQEEVGILEPMPTLPGCNAPYLGPGLPSTKPACSTTVTPDIGSVVTDVAWANHNGFSTTTPVYGIWTGETSSVPLTPPVTPTTAPLPAPTTGGSLYLCNVSPWQGCNNFQWTTNACNSLLGSPQLYNIHSIGPDQGSCTLYSDLSCNTPMEGLTAITNPGSADVGWVQAGSFMCQYPTILPPVGSGTTYVCTQGNWGNCQVWSWDSYTCHSFENTEFDNNLGSYGPNSGMCTLYTDIHCEQPMGKHLNVGNPGNGNVGSDGKLARAILCI